MAVKCYLLSVQKRMHSTVWTPPTSEVGIGNTNLGASTELTMCIWTNCLSVLYLCFLICKNRGNSIGLEVKYLWKEGKAKGEKEEGEWERGKVGGKRDAGRIGTYLICED